MTDIVIPDRPRPEPPARIARLPMDRGFHVPWFVAWIDGKPEFRAADPVKHRLAITKRLCWVCGDILGRYLTFVIGPMCAINRISAEPPCHLECARYSAAVCPFLSRPHMERRENDLPEGATCPGVQIRRNPGATLLWTTRGYTIVPDSGRGLLFNIGDPESTEWWAEGRAATRSEVLASVDSGLPILMEMAERQGPAAVKQLLKMKATSEQLYPKV